MIEHICSPSDLRQRRNVKAILKGRKIKDVDQRIVDATFVGKAGMFRPYRKLTFCFRCRRVHAFSPAARGNKKARRFPKLKV